MTTRRKFLHGSAAGLVSALAASRAAFATAPTDNRLVLIFLRGGLDGLHALAPFADPDYHKLRPKLALKGEDIISLDGYFGLNRALEPLMPLYRAGELLFVPASSTSYRNRSHFDGQNMLENGSGKPYGARDGWLNRAILGLNDNDRRLGLALSPSIPLILQGEARIQTWAESGLPEVDEDFLFRVAQLYQNDPLFLDAFHDAQGALKPDVDRSMMEGNSRQSKDFQLSVHAAADLLSHDHGPRIAALELQGWDTHFAQDRRLKSLLALVANGIETLRGELGSVWAKTTVMVVSEFGRTAAENGSRGTDHGTGGLAMLAGGKVAGGRIAGDWPGLSRTALFEERDLRAVNSYEAIFKAILIDRFVLSQSFIGDHVFPGDGTSPMDGLFT